MRNKIAAVLMSAVVALGLGVSNAAVANAAVNLDSNGWMTLVCRDNHNQDYSWYARLKYPNQGGWGWRCEQLYTYALTGLNIEGFCQNVYGLHARGGSTAWNWRCDY